MSDLERDRELAERAAGGDQVAWKTIYDETSDRLFALLCYQVGDREQALDLLQDTYLRAFSRLDGYRGDAPLSVWLRRIAFRKAMDWKRGLLQRLKRTVELNETTAAEFPEVDHVRFDHEKAAFEGALAALSPNQRAVLILREWESWSFEEIAGALRCKASTARVHHVRAKEKMRQLLNDDPSWAADGLEGQTV
ncbi:MAG: RNA polymerase sigma factor [Candidatus Eisenbacteria bacterium]